MEWWWLTLGVYQTTSSGGDPQTQGDSPACFFSMSSLESNTAFSLSSSSFCWSTFFLLVHTHTHTHHIPCQTTNHFQMHICVTVLPEWLIHLHISIHFSDFSLSLISQSFFPVNDHIQTQWPLNNQEEKRKVWTVLGSSWSTGPKIWKENQFHSHDSLLATNKNKKNWPRFSCTLLLLITFI